MPKTRTDSERTMTMTRLSVWIAGVLVVICALTCAAVAQMPRHGHGQAPGILPSGLGDAVDRDVAKVRAATDRFKSTEAAEAAGYARVTDCVEHQPAGAMGYHFQNNTLLDTTLDVDHPEVLVYETQAGRRVQTERRRIPRADLRVDGRRAAAHHGAGPQARRSPGHLVPPRLDVGAQSERSLCRLESPREVRNWRQPPAILGEGNSRHAENCATRSSEGLGRRTAHLHGDLIRAGQLAGALSRGIPIVDRRQVAGHRARSRFVRKAGRHPPLLRQRQRRAGYRTGTFPDGSIVVDEAVFTKDGEGRASGILLEGDRRFLDVMVKDGRRFETTGGGAMSTSTVTTGRAALGQRASGVLRLPCEGAGRSRVQPDPPVRPLERG